MAVWLLKRSEVAKRLAEFECVFIEDVENPEDDFYAFAYWRAGNGHHFTLPLVGPDRLCPEHHVYSVLAELALIRDQQSNNNGKNGRTR